MTLRKGNRTLRKRPIFAPLLIPALSVIVGLLVIAWVWNAAETTTVILVRHAEKMPEPVDDPDLSAMGAYRAKALAGWLRDAGIEHIYVSQFKRTQQTAAPVAKAIDASVHGDTVLVSPGTYVDNIDFKGKAITVKSTDTCRLAQRQRDL